jgi:uncharacterized protein (DUF2147 family)
MLPICIANRFGYDLSKNNIRTPKVAISLPGRKHTQVISDFKFLMEKRSIFIFLLCFWAYAVAAQDDITGTWKVVDNASNDIKYHVRIYDFEGRMFGKVVKMVKMPPSQTCPLCPGDLRNQPIMNMILVEKMQLSNGFYKNGRMLDPQNGRWYSCQMWLKEEDPDVLVVRGFLGFIYFTQYWYRVR